MRKYILLSVLLSLCNISNLYAGAQADGITYRNKFDVETEKFAWWCDSATRVQNALTTDFDDVEKVYKINKSLVNNWVDYSGFFYVAREMKEGGMKFCTTIVGADRSNCHTKPYTTYHESDGKCFWLCYSGYYGPECAKTNEAATCLPTDWVEKNRFESKTAQLYKATKGEDIDSQIPMLYQGVYRDCSGLSRYHLCSTHKQEHDMIVILRSIVSEKGGYTFTVQPAVVRAGGAWQSCDGTKAGRYAWPMITFIENTITEMCPEGWKFDDGKKVCMQDTTQPACQLNNLCDGFPRDKFDPDVYQVSEGSACQCYEYRCLSGAFKSKEDHTCVPCPATDVDIPSLYYVDEDGICQKCEIGQWPGDTSKNSCKKEGEEFIQKTVKECKKATPFTHNELQYGQKNVPDTVTTTQCWTKTNPDDFFGCVAGYCRDGKVVKDTTTGVERCTPCEASEKYDSSQKTCVKK